MTWIQASKRGRMSPFPNYLSMQSITSIMEDVIGYSYTEIIQFFQNRMMNVFWHKEEHEKIQQMALEKAKKDPLLIKRLIEKVEKLGVEFIESTKKIHNSDLSQRSDEELKEMHRKYCNDYKQIYSTYFVIITMENSLLDYLKNYINGMILDEEAKSRYLSILTTSTKAMFSKEEEKELLKIALDAGKISEEDLRNRVKKHTEKYFWLTRDYEDPISTENDFLQRLDNIIKEGNVKEKIEKLEEFYRKEDKIKEIEKELKIDAFHSRLFEMMRDGIYLKELRKRLVSESLYYMDNLLIEIGKRKNLDIKQMRHLMAEEIDEEGYNDVLDSRIALSAFLVKNGKTSVFHGEEAQKLKNEIITMPDDIKELKGLAVSPGKAKGPARIVFDPQDISKVKPGDIMVTVQAVPSFTPAIKIAAALIADGGTGITSHPATLAREAGIPCITGVRIGTEVLKDGDIVEVDAEKGIVRKIKEVDYHAK